MILDVILGINMDTDIWIEELFKQKAEHIAVLDYEYWGEPILIKGILHISIADFQRYKKQFDTVNYYKSLYVYPGMGGKMSSLYKL